MAWDISDLYFWVCYCFNNNNTAFMAGVWVIYEPGLFGHVIWHLCIGVLPVAIVSIRECVFNAAVGLHILVEFWMDQSRRVLVREGFALTVCALRPEIGAVWDLRLLHTRTRAHTHTHTHRLENLYCFWRHKGVLAYITSINFIS